MKPSPFHLRPTIVLKIVVDIDPDPAVEVLDTIYVRVPIFDDILENEYWEYDNHGLKLLQVWICDNSTDVSAGDQPEGEWNNEPEL